MKIIVRTATFEALTDKEKEMIASGLKSRLPDQFDLDIKHWTVGDWLNILHDLDPVFSFWKEGEKEGFYMDGPNGETAFMELLINAISAKH